MDMRKLPEQLKCRHCQIIMDLEEAERIDNRFTCTNCGKQIDMTGENNPKKNLEIMQPPIVYHDNKILDPYAIEILKNMIN
jgi:NAD-dependent SIR2 family protein deacetylase